MAENHDIPEWFMPDGTNYLGELRGEAEKEHVEETGEPLPEGVCPHCGDEYLKQSLSGAYVHSWTTVETDSKVTSLGQGNPDRTQPATWCVDGEKHSHLSRKYE